MMIGKFVLIALLFFFPVVNAGAQEVGQRVAETTDSYHKLLIPNAFSPNGDGINDRFKILNLTTERVLEFRIINRWGTNVYKSEASSPQGWDGTYKGQPQPAGTYGFIIKVQQEDGTESIYKGLLTLIR